MSDLRKLLGLGDDVKLTKGEKQLADLIEQQQARIDELAAAADRLLDVINKAGVALAMLPRDALGEVPDNHERQGWFIRDELIYNLEQAVKTSPTTNLNAARREAYREGFMSSAEGFNGELYEDGWRKVVASFDEELNQRYPDKE